jgi:hypothetical protein
MRAGSDRWRSSIVAERRMTSPPASDPARCPLCGRNNNCALAAGRINESCWCTNVTVTGAMLARISADRRGAACVCAACVARLAAGKG